LDLALRTGISGWAGRLWTWQEAVLAKHPHIQFADCSLPAISLALEGTEEKVDFRRGWYCYHDTILLYSDVFGLYAGAKREPRGDTTSYIDFYMVQFALQFRSTSVLADEPLCLGSLFGLDVNKIAQANPQDRMEVFWSLITEFPRMVVFWPGGTLSNPGFRWAPRTFLGIVINFTLDRETSKTTNGPQASLTLRGLKVQFPGIKFHPTSRSIPIARIFWVNDKEAGDVDKQIYQVTGRFGSPRQTFQTPTYADPTRMALIISESKDETSTLVSWCTMVFIREEIDGVLYVHRGESAYINFADTSSSNRQPQIASSQYKEGPLQEETSNKIQDEMGHYIVNGQYSGIQGKRLNDQQVWCVD
jgi:hypothetical protein